MIAAEEIQTIRHPMTPKEIDSFVAFEMEKGASGNMLRRYKGALKVLYNFLPEDKCITRELLLDWRKRMEDNGYASITILNYVKYINRYLDYAGCAEIRFNRGKAKDIAGMTFGYLSAVQPTGAKNRKDIVWLFACKCGNTIELPATRVITGNTLSCGCLKGERLKKTNQCYAGTSLKQSLTDRVKSTRSVSGYTGVTPKRDKWHAYITYKGVHYSLGSYWDIGDAVKARARAKELVMADAQGLLDFYTELEKSFPQLPNKNNVPRKEFANTEWTVNNTPNSAATRSDNTSGYRGVSFRKGKWETKICYRGIRYMLGRFDNLDEAIEARKAADRLLREDPQRFVEECLKKYRHHHI